MTSDVTGDVNDTTNETQATPAPPWRFSLRATAADRAIVQRIVEAHRRMGLTISLNDAILVAIRRTATPDADSQEEAWRRIEQHWSDCPYACGPQNIGCPEGWRLHDSFHRTKPHTPGWRPQLPRSAGPSPAPPPPLPAEPPALHPEDPAGWRRYFRKAS